MKRKLFEAGTWAIATCVVTLPILLTTYATLLHVRYSNIGISWWNEVSLMFLLYFTPGALLAVGTVLVLVLPFALTPKLVTWPALVVEVPVVAWIIGWLLWLNDVVRSEEQGYEILALTIVALFASRLLVKAILAKRTKRLGPASA